MVVVSQQREAMRDVRWSPYKSTVFATLSASCLNLYDLSQDHVDPVATFHRLVSNLVSIGPFEMLRLLSTIRRPYLIRKETEKLRIINSKLRVIEIPAKFVNNKTQVKSNN